MVRLMYLIVAFCTITSAKFPQFSSDLLEETKQNFDFSVHENFFTEPVYKWYTSKYSHMIKHPQCRPDLTTTYVPIYYMPSHTVALDCAACSIDKLENDSPKIWRMAHEDNFYKTLENLRDSLNWVHIKMGLMEINSNEVAGTFMNERQTTARQSGTRLYLIGATPFAGGLYTCDLAYLPLGNVPEVVYVVMPMVIPTRLQPLLGWRSTEFYFPYLPIYGRFHDNVLWGWNWMWTAILHPVTQVRNVSAVPMWNDITFPVRPPADFKLEELTEDYNTTSSLDSMNLRIDNVWGSWTPCSACKPNFGKRTRQGHCLLRKIQYNKPITLPKRLTSDMKNLFAADVMVEVVTDLNEIFSKSPFTYEGIRCWSLPILLAGVRGGRNPPCLNWLKIPKLRGITWELERYLGEMVQKRSDLTSGCLMWFHNLFHSQFGPASEPEIRADNPYYPFQPWANYKPDWKILTGAASHWLVEDHNDWMETVLRVLKLSLNTKSLPVCGSAGYYIDYEECMETRCVSG